MKGGRRSRSGPSPDPYALRRDWDGLEWVVLPERGRDGPPPPWPLPDPTARELALWRREWARPQAVAWEAAGQVLEVGLYVRTVADAEAPSAPVSVRRLLAQQMAHLGLTAAGLRSNRWRIGIGGES